jgi:hypothetical protein
MMQSAQNSRRSNDMPIGEVVPIGPNRSLCVGGLRKSRPERRVWTTAIVVNDELSDDPLQVPFAKWNEIVPRGTPKTGQ